ncbi:hypothetical protein CCR75_001790 [Bremia lactucae]|uniref:Uncharacterized protein n=1 Tax=Bremia lactucae TaxID=4779 RepID=A0A976IH90_BRELC|nr:hypothetical protein CCR75_001790 [Bremia lactucae]
MVSLHLSAQKTRDPRHTKQWPFFGAQILSVMASASCTKVILLFVALAAGGDPVLEPAKTPTLSTTHLDSKASHGEHLDNSYSRPRISASLSKTLSRKQLRWLVLPTDRALEFPQFVERVVELSHTLGLPHLVVQSMAECMVGKLRSQERQPSEGRCYSSECMVGMLRSQERSTSECMGKLLPSRVKVETFSSPECNLEKEGLLSHLTLAGMELLR